MGAGEAFSELTPEFRNRNGIQVFMRTLIFRAIKIFWEGGGIRTSKSGVSRYVDEKAALLLSWK